MDTPRIGFWLAVTVLILSGVGLPYCLSEGLWLAGAINAVVFLYWIVNIWDFHRLVYHPGNVRSHPKRSRDPNGRDDTRGPGAA